jgi:endonuclease/exonuclease/phosphatase family metal-dependent hydrolase
LRAWGALYRGYAGRFMKRTGDQQDGCALLWRESRLRLCAARDLAYRVSSRFDRDNVGQLVALHAVGESGGDGDSAGATIVVGNTHVLFNPRRGDVKLQQVATLLAAAAAMSDELSGAQGGRGVPVVVCGDFNSAPFSPIYDFLASGTISLTSSHPGPAHRTLPPPLHCLRRAPTARARGQGAGPSGAVWTGGVGGVGARGATARAA